MNIQIKIFQSLLKKKNLTTFESEKLAKSFFEKNVDNLKLSSLLTLLHIKNESFNEIYAFVKILKKKSKKLDLKGDLMDTCGTGGDNKNSFNFSTAVSILLASCGVKIAKHGNRSITSKSGSFDILESLGVNIHSTEKEQKQFFNAHGICFLFAPNYHQSLKNFSNLRTSLPFRTIFNLLGPLLNPSKLKYQLLGVSRKENLLTHSECLKKLGIKKAWTVYNLNGFDELTTTGMNLIIEVKNKTLKKKKLNPQELGFKLRSENDLLGGTSSENAFILKRLFEGETGAIRDNVLLNTGAGLLIAEKVSNIHDGIQLAKRNIDNGLASKKLQSLIK